jgi:hypothetical protein
MNLKEPQLNPLDGFDGIYRHFLSVQIHIHISNAYIRSCTEDIFLRNAKNLRCIQRNVPELS